VQQCSPRDDGCKNGGSDRNTNDAANELHAAQTGMNIGEDEKKVRKASTSDNVKAEQMADGGVGDLRRSKEATAAVGRCSSGEVVAKICVRAVKSVGVHDLRMTKSGVQPWCGCM
jgi:hypothetical protein